MASNHTRTAACFDRLANLLADAAAEAALCAAAARALDDDAVYAARVTYKPPYTVIAGLTAALVAWTDDYARAIDTAQPEPGSILGN